LLKECEKKEREGVMKGAREGNIWQRNVARHTVSSKSVGTLPTRKSSAYQLKQGPNDYWEGYKSTRSSIHASNLRSNHDGYPQILSCHGSGTISVPSSTSVNFPSRGYSSHYPLSLLLAFLWFASMCMFQRNQWLTDYCFVFSSTR
jgi:hypothetical protein